MKNIKLAVIVGVWWGFLIGLQQSSSIIISSLHDLGEFPYLSVLAVAFNIVLAGLLMSVLLTLAVFSSSLFGKRSAKWESSTWVSILLAIGAAAWSYAFLGLKFLPILSKNRLIPTVLLVITVVAGGLLGFMLYSSWQTVVKRKKIELKLSLAMNILSKLGLVLYAVLLLFVLINIAHRVRNGRVGFALGEFGRHRKDKVNILLITIDALRSDSLTADLMPNTFAFAQKGLSHSRAYAPSPWTPPSFVAMLTGKDPGEVGTSVYNFSMDEAVNTHNIPKEVYTLAEELGDNGYLNQAIVTNKNLVDRRGYDQGFDGFINFEDLLPYHWHFHGKNMALVGVAQRIPFVGTKIEGFYHFLFGKTAEDAFRTRANMLTDTALEWLGRKRQTPFFLWLHYIDPHSPYNPVPEFSPELAEIGEGQEQKMRQPHLEAGDIRWNRERQEALKLLYDGETSYLDAQLGRIYDQLENSELLKSTIVVITSDHGEEFLERGNLGHGKTLYEELVKVPLVVRFDGNQSLASGFSEKPVSLTDLPPTLLSFLGIIDDAARDWFSEEYAPTVFVEGNSAGLEQKAAIAGNWKLIWDTDAASYELYNLESDPGEKDNVASSNPSVVGELSQFLKERVEKNREAYQKLQEQQGFAPPIDFGEVVGY